MSQAAALPKDSVCRPQTSNPLSSDIIVPSKRGSLFSSPSAFTRRIISAYREKQRAKNVKRCLEYLSAHANVELENICRKKAIEMGVQYSVIGVQALLDREGIQHCFACVERFGLRKTPRGYACKAHAEEAANSEGSGCRA